MKRLVLSACGILVLLQPAQAIVRRHDVADASYIARGAEAQFAPVGFVGLNGGFGSGTLVAPQWVLTAAHCVTYGLSAVSFTLRGSTYSILETIVHPDWDLGAGNVGAALATGGDLALLRLSSPVVGITPASLYTGSDELGATGTFVGFGQTGTGITGDSAAGGTRRGAENTIDALGTFFGIDARLLLADFDDPTGTKSLLGSATAQAREGSIGRGDSGGAYFMNASGWRLAGVNSFIAALDPPDGDGVANAQYGELMGATRVSLYASWIQTNAHIAPEPTTLALALLGGICLKRRRRVI